MAQYKVPQDVEAEDKLIGPFTFRQFVYLIIIGALLGLAYLLFRIFPLLCIIPAPFILLLSALALPIKKDQPMETYLSAIISFYLKPRTRTWEPGEPESTIKITAPKQVEKARTKNLDEGEALHRLSFLADIVDTEGYAIKGVAAPAASRTAIKDEVYAEASNAQDIFEAHSTNTLINENLEHAGANRHQAIVDQMRDAIAKNRTLSSNSIERFADRPPVETPPSELESPNIHLSSDDKEQTSPVPTAPPLPAPQIIPDTPATSSPTIVTPDNKPQNASASPINPDIINLANNSDFTVETIAKEAKRINEKQNRSDEVYISLH